MAPKAARVGANQKRPRERTDNPKKTSKKKQRGAPVLQSNESRAESRDDALSIAFMAAHLIVALRSDPVLARKLKTNATASTPTPTPPHTPTGKKATPDALRRAVAAAKRMEQRRAAAASSSCTSRPTSDGGG